MSDPSTTKAESFLLWSDYKDWKNHQEDNDE